MAVKKIMICIVLLYLFTGSVFAEYDSSNWYGGIGFGVTKSNVPSVSADQESDLNEMIDFKDQDNSTAQLFVGYNFNNYLGLELAYHGPARIAGLSIARSSLSGLAFESVKLDITCLSLTAKGVYPINEQLNVFAKLGVIDWRLEEDFYDEVNGHIDEDVTTFKDNDVLVAVGMRFKQFEVSYQQYELNVLDGLNFDVKYLGVAYIFNF